MKGLQAEIKNHSQDSSTDRGDRIQQNLQLCDLFIKRLEFHGPCELRITVNTHQ